MLKYYFNPKSVLSLVAVLFLFPTVAVQAQDREPQEGRFSFEDEYLLIINTYTTDAPWSNAIIEPVQHWAAGKQIPVFAEHLNMLMIDDTAKFRKMEASLFAKYEGNTPKALLMLGNSALLLRNGIRNHWGNIPIVLCAEEDYIGPDEAYIKKYPVPEKERTPLSELAKDYNMTVLQSKLFLKENVALLQRMIPGLKKIILIGDGRYVNQQLDYEMKELLAEAYPGLEYEFLLSADMNIEELLRRIGRVDPATTGVLFSSLFNKTDYAGGTILTASSYHMIANTSVPVFVLKKAVMSNSGIVGGYFYDDRAYLSRLRKTLEAVITGTPAREIAAYIPSDAIPAFNYPALRMRGFSEEVCPPGSIFLERPLTFWEENKFIIITGGSLAALLLLFLLIYQRRRIRALKELNEERRQKLESNNELAKLFDDMPIAYSKGKFARNAEGEIADLEIVRMNRRFIKNFIKDPGRLREQKAGEILGPDFKMFLQFVKLMESERKSLTYSQYFSTIEQYLDIVITGATQKDHVNIYMINATVLYKTQKKLNDINKKLAMSLDVANIVPWSWDLINHQILCDVNRPVELTKENPAVHEDRLAVPEEEYFSKIHKEDRPRVELAFRNLVEGKIDKIREEYRVISRTHTDCKQDWVEARATVENRDEKGRPRMLVGSSLIITQRKNMERDLIDARDKAEESNRLKSAFLANMSHEIRTPLNAIIGFSGMLNSVEVQEEREEYVRIIENNNDLLLQLISDILDLSKIEAGTLEFIETPVDLTALLEDMLRSMEMRAREKGLSVSLEEHPSGCVILTDRNRLNQVLTNLITNSIKFTEEGGITIGFHFQENSKIRFNITDTGCGIPADQQKEIFKRFTKLNNFAQGTGLGLPICQMIVEKLGGEIGVESEPGKGSTFWFTIDYRPVKQQIKNTAPDKPLIPVRSDEITILIAEDNVSNFKLFETILKKDYRILHAWDGREAVNMFKAHRPHIVLMDISMPVMDGYEATTEIRKITRDVPILAITAYAYATDEQHILNYGFDGYAAKPINARMLRSKINELIKTRLLLIL